MPLNVAQLNIEQSDFMEGWMPDAEPAHAPPAGLLQSMNLLPNPATGTLETRKGYKRKTNGRVNITGFYIRHIFQYHYMDGGETFRFLICIVTNEQNAANNVRVYAYDLAAETMTRIDTAGRTWAGSGNRPFWGATIQGVFYGGCRGELMFSASYSGSTWTWDADPSVPDIRTLLDGIDASVTTTTQYARDHAFTKGTRVLYNGRYFTAKRNILFKDWKTDVVYKRGQYVSVRQSWSGSTYYKSFQAKTNHTATAGNKPTSTGNTQWRQVQLGLPENDGSDVNVQDWELVPTAAQTSVGVFHGERLWLRYDDSGNRSRLQYSEPLKPSKGDAISDLTFDPQGFKPADTIGGDGGGWEDFRSGDGDAIMALQSFGQYLLVFKRRSTHVISGYDSNTWTKRILGHVGASNHDAVTEHEGLVYFLGDQGLYVTDGTATQEVQGYDKVREYIRDKVNWSTGRADVSLFSYGGFVWMSMPHTQSHRPGITILYHPETASFWPLSLNIQGYSVGRDQGVDNLYFSSPSNVGTNASGFTFVWDGTEQRSTSTRSDTEVNYITDPSFEPKVTTGVEASPLGYESQVSAKASSNWVRTNTHLKWHISTNAALDGIYGAVMENTRKPGTNTTVDTDKDETGDTKDLQPDTTDTYEGLVTSVADAGATTHSMSIYARRADWKKNRKLRYGTIRLVYGGTLANPTAVARADHTFTYVGAGWYRISATFTGAATAAYHGVVIAPGMKVHVDKAMVTAGATLEDWFSGDGGDDDGYAQGHGPYPVLYLYDHPDVRSTPMDDRNKSSHTPRPFAWSAQTAWFSFATARMERRVRRTWSLVRGQFPVLLRGYRNYRHSAEYELARDLTGGPQVEHFEGQKMPDAYAVSFEVEGLGAPGALLGVAVDTEHRRTRYHVG